MRHALVALVLLGCAAVPPRRTPPRHYAEDGWIEHVGVLFVRIQPPDSYRTVANLFPFFVTVGGLEHSRSAWQHAEPFSPISEARNYEWDEPLIINLFLNTARFVRHGFFYVRPFGLTRVPNPLRERCPEDLLQAAISDMHGRNQLILEPHLVGRDDHYGCVYRFDYIID